MKSPSAAPATTATVTLVKRRAPDALSNRITLADGYRKEQPIADRQERGGRMRGGAVYSPVRHGRVPARSDPAARPAAADSAVMEYLVSMSQVSPAGSSRHIGASAQSR
jgi:hypothetical protein